MRASLLIAADNPHELSRNCQTLQARLQARTENEYYPPFPAVWPSPNMTDSSSRLGLVADSVEEAVASLQTALEVLRRKESPDS